MVSDCHSDFLKKGFLVPPSAFISLSGFQCPYPHLSVSRVQPRHPTLSPQALLPFGIQHRCFLPSSEFSGQGLTLWLLLEKEMATYSSILAWTIPWTGEPGREQSMGSQRVGHDLATTLWFPGKAGRQLGQITHGPWLRTVILGGRWVSTILIACPWPAGSLPNSAGLREPAPLV